MAVRASASSTRRKCGEIAASSGNRRSSDWQKAWMVPMRMPPGRSSTWANSARAAARESSPPGIVRAASSLSSAESSSVTQRPSRCWSRSAISAAAALVKVRHWMRDGSAPVSIRRSMRSVSSLVLPDPADAATKAETAGSDAWRCSASARSRAAVGRPALVKTFIRRPPTRPTRRHGQAARNRRTGGRRPDAAGIDRRGRGRRRRQSRRSARAPP